MPKRKSKPRTLYGVCFFYSETGTEGGYWAFQDTRYIRKSARLGYCKKCGKWLRDQDGPIQIKGVYSVTEEVLRTGKLPKQPSCPANAHEEKIDESWDYKGLHLLKNGDRLTIYSKDNPKEIVWSGIIRLRQYSLFKESASGAWIHADQENMDREIWAKWFFKEYPAKLVTARGKHLISKKPRGRGK